MSEQTQRESKWEDGWAWDRVHPEAPWWPADTGEVVRMLVLRVATLEQNPVQVIANPDTSLADRLKAIEKMLAGMAGPGRLTDRVRGMEGGLSALRTIFDSHASAHYHDGDTVVWQSRLDKLMEPTIARVEALERRLGPPDLRAQTAPPDVNAENLRFQTSSQRPLNPDYTVPHFERPTDGLAEAIDKAAVAAMDSVGLYVSNFSSADLPVLTMPEPGASLQPLADELRLVGIRGRDGSGMEGMLVTWDGMSDGQRNGWLAIARMVSNTFIAQASGR